MRHIFKLPSKFCKIFCSADTRQEKFLPDIRSEQVLSQKIDFFIQSLARILTEITANFSLLSNFILEYLNAQENTEDINISLLSNIEIENLHLAIQETLNIVFELTAELEKYAWDANQNEKNIFLAWIFACWYRIDIAVYQVNKKITALIPPDFSTTLKIKNLQYQSQYNVAAMLNRNTPERMPLRIKFLNELTPEAKMSALKKK